MHEDVKKIYVTLLKASIHGTKLRKVKTLYGDWIGLMYEDDSCHAVRPFLDIDGYRLRLIKDE